MKSIHYSGYELHKRLHDNLRDKTLPALESELEKQNYSVESVQHFLGICVGWLNGHIMVEDLAITGRVPEKWVHQPAEDEVDSLEKAIIQALDNLFRVKAEVVSSHYSGEDFSMGKVLCYRLVYTSPGREPLYAYLIYEEKMVLSVLSEALGRKVAKVDKTVYYAMKVLSQQFMECLAEHFVLPEHAFDKTDVMTFEQITRAFYKHYPPYSLLFNTEHNGYFAMCIDLKK